MGCMNDKTYDGPCKLCGYSDNTPILGIEVDGVLHHRFDEVQVARDRRKNGILVKIGLPLLRLSTDGSSEKERIVGALEQAMQQG